MRRMPRRSIRPHEALLDTTVKLDHTVQAEPAEGVVQNSLGCLAGEPLALPGRRQAPADLDGRGEECFERNVHHPAQADQSAAPALFQRPVAPSMFGKMRLDPIEHGVRAGAGDGREIALHFWLGIDGREWRAVFRAPLAQTQALAGKFHRFSCLGEASPTSKCLALLASILGDMTQPGKQIPRFEITLTQRWPVARIQRCSASRRAAWHRCRQLPAGVRRQGSSGSGAASCGAAQMLPR